MYIQKCASYQSGVIVVGLKKSVPFVIRLVPETKLSGEWLSVNFGMS